VPAAGALNVTVAVEFVKPPGTLVKFRERDAIAGSGVTVRAALCVPPLSVAEIFAVVVAPTA